ncbi:hypothetical protein [Vibrio sp. CyArs1]|uniref:hypothetical protein n=1 Tax=Vibrio sp. CyArs1 TaxID=2682577 RepID=UPI001F051D83|nr:hypothetical protein [Vibrio sp. CyArs1]
MNVDERNNQREAELLQSLDWLPSNLIAEGLQRKALRLTSEGDNLFLKDQFDTQGKIYDALLSILPALKQYGDLFAIDWLYREKQVLITRARATCEEFQQALEKGIVNVELDIAEIEFTQSDYVTAKPMDLLLNNKPDLFEVFFEDWHLNDTRKIPTIEIDRFKVWLDSQSDR